MTRKKPDFGNALSDEHYRRFMESTRTWFDRYQADCLTPRLPNRPPINNMGGTPKAPEAGKPEAINTVRLMKRGRQVVIESPVNRQVAEQVGLIDWVNFTIGDDTYRGAFADDDFLFLLSMDLMYVLGFGVTRQRDKGLNFYAKSWELGDGYGFVCKGGQRGTVSVMLNGTGCAAAAPGWEKRLYEFLHLCQRPAITRLDLAYDDLDGSEYTVDQAFADFNAGLFTCNYRTPECQQLGDWVNPNGKGRTFYVGHRRNGKFCRVYEKGKQLGDPESLWVRVEVELKSVDRVIPFEALLSPGQYLAGAYPAFGWICQQTERIEVTRRTSQIQYAKAVKWLRHQVGAYLWVVAEMEGSLEKAFRLLMREKFPDRLRVPNWNEITLQFHECYGSNPIEGIGEGIPYPA